VPERVPVLVAGALHRVADVVAGERHGTSRRKPRTQDSRARGFNLSRAAGRALFQLAALRERPPGDAEWLSIDGLRAVGGVTRLALPLPDIRIRRGRVGDQLVVVLSGHNRDPEVRLLSSCERNPPDAVDIAQVRRAGRFLTEPSTQGLHTLVCSGRHLAPAEE